MYTNILRGRKALPAAIVLVLALAFGSSCITLSAYPPVMANPDAEDLLIPTTMDMALGYAVWTNASPATVAALGAVYGGGAALVLLLCWIEC